jgi:dipeptidyl aminopeptidase/acylaminoacyl peptidase
LIGSTALIERWGLRLVRDYNAGCMRFTLSLFLALTAASSLHSQPPPTQTPAPPDTDIVLASLAPEGSGFTLGRPVNITTSPGYDNQPSFTPDGRTVLFTSMRGGRQTDIYQYDIAAGTTKQVTNTPENEYSPTVTPDRGHISVIRVEADGTQRLWQFTLDGRDPALVLSDVKPVGYHAWVDRTTLTLFVLGQPATLQVADTATGRAEIVARDIARSLQPIPSRGTVSFVARERSDPPGAARLLVRELDPRAKTVTPLVAAPAGAREADLAWTPDGVLLVVKDDVLYGWRRGSADWKAVADLGAMGLRGVSRIAVSPTGGRIALVVTSFGQP